MRHVTPHPVFLLGHCPVSHVPATRGLFRSTLLDISNGCQKQTTSDLCNMAIKYQTVEKAQQSQLCRHNKWIIARHFSVHSVTVIGVKKSRILLKWVFIIIATISAFFAQ